MGRSFSFRLEDCCKGGGAALVLADRDLLADSMLAVYRMFVYSLPTDCYNMHCFKVNTNYFKFIVPALLSVSVNFFN